jgi:hypothetical protein
MIFLRERFDIFRTQAMDKPALLDLIGWQSGNTLVLVASQNRFTAA